MLDTEHKHKIIIATDSFKGSLTSFEAGSAIEEGIKKARPDWEAVVVPVSDGGEGLTDVLCSACKGDCSQVEVHGPLGQIITAQYGIIESHTAVLETARACGLTLIPPHLRNPMRTSTFGVGEMIIDALAKGCNKFIVGVGGSSTNDGGTGMLSALGYGFFDANGHALEGKGESLGKIAKIDSSKVCDSIKGENIEFSVACDVDTPFCGPTGASVMFAPQKGATTKIVAALEDGMSSFENIVFQCLGSRLCDIPGSGAAGGLGGAFRAFLKAELRPGIDLVLDAIRFDDILQEADLVITGEGRMDRQTLHGKTPMGILRHAGRLGIPVIAFCGQATDTASLIEAGFSSIHIVTPPTMSVSEAMYPDTARRNLQEAAFTACQSGINCL